MAAFAKTATDIYNSLPELSPFYSYLKQPTFIDYPGQMAAMFFTTGCNFHCGFCHNAPLFGERKKGLKSKEVLELLNKFRSRDWVSAVVISGGEPTLSPDLPLFISWIKSLGFLVKLDTNGSNPAMLEQMLPEIDYVAMDIKCSLERYPEFVKYNDTDAILASVKLIKEQAVDYEFRTTVLDEIHTKEEMLAVAPIIQGANKYMLQPFVPQENLLDERYKTMKRTSPDLLQELKSLLKPYAKQIEVKGKQ